MGTLKSYKQFCACDEQGKPKNPFTGERADLKNTRSWGYPGEVKQQKKGVMLGISQYSEAQEPLVLVRVSGKNALRDEIAESLHTYHQSNGQHDEYLCSIDPDTTLIHRGVDRVAKTDNGTIEIQEKSYFLPLKGQPDSIEVTNCTTAIKFLIDKYFDQTIRIFEKAEEKITDAEAIRLAKEDPNFSDLYAGDWQDLTDTKKEAEKYVLRVLAFYTGGNKAQVERLYRQSGLYDDEFEEMDAMDRYNGEKLINKICAENRMQNAGYEEEIDTSLAYKMDLAAKNEIAKQRALAPQSLETQYDMSDTGNAHRMADRFGQILRYSEANRKWFIYNHEEGRWIENDGILVKKMADQIIEELKEEVQYKSSSKEQEEAFKFALKSSSHQRKEAFIDETKHLGNIPIVSRETFEPNDMMLNVKNGTIDLATGKLLPHDPRHMCSHMAPVVYDPEEKRQPERFLTYLKQWIPDEEMRQYVHKMLGYTLTGLTTEQCLFFLIGIGNDGKSTLLQIIAEIMGDYACNAQPDTFMMKQYKSSSGPSSDVARLSGKRLVYAEEATEGCRLDEGLVKQMTSSSKITARFMRENEYEFTPRFKIWMPSNYKPVIRGTDKGIWRRIRMVNFPHSLRDDEVDKMLVYNLREEYPLILKWLVDGCVAWYAEDMRTGTDLPGEMQDEVKQYRKEMDIVSSFMDDCMIIAEPGAEDSKNKISIPLMYQMFTGWAREGNEYEMPRRKFTKEVKAFCEHNGIDCRKSTGNVEYLFGVYQTSDANRYCK